MEFIDPLLSALAPMNFMFIVLGVVLGITVGAIPGLTGSMLIALSLPFTFTMEATNAISMLVSMYVGAVSGSLITAVLMRMPGTAASVMTTFDGYPMTEQGKAGRAIGLGIFASFVGGIISWVFLVLLARPLSIIAVRFSPFDFFAMIMMALALLVVLSRGNMLKGLIAGFFGMLISLPGLDPIGGNYRFTYGFEDLRDGFKLLPGSGRAVRRQPGAGRGAAPGGERATEGRPAKPEGHVHELGRHGPATAGECCAPR
jgi:putative tricarboxylic transport membrane protein